MKNILASRQPEIVRNVLNKKASVLVFKKFPKDYVGWVYIYCTLDNKLLAFMDDDGVAGTIGGKPRPDRKYFLNGKVVARFWCDKVEEIYYLSFMNEKLRERIYKESCLTDEQIGNYMRHNDTMYAIHISKLEVFDKPRKLSEFKTIKRNVPWTVDNIKGKYDLIIKPINKAPSNYCYIEGEE